MGMARAPRPPLPPKPASCVQPQAAVPSCRPASSPWPAYTRTWNKGNQRQYALSIHNTDTKYHVLYHRLLIIHNDNGKCKLCTCARSSLCKMKTRIIILARHPSGTGQIASRVTLSRVFRGHQAGINTLSFMRDLGINDAVCISPRHKKMIRKYIMSCHTDDFLSSGF